MSKKRIVCIGGGAAGFFAALLIKEKFPDASVAILEKSLKPLAKVKVSGGGRCNVTHHCFEPKDLAGYYPRGSLQLKKIFYHFQPKDMIAWLAKRGVELKVEGDGRMFPVSNSSAAIIDCFYSQAHLLGVDIETGMEVTEIKRNGDTFHLQCREKDPQSVDAIVIATGSSMKGYDLAARLGHEIIEPVPSLFTFTIKDPRLEGLAGVSMPSVIARLKGTKLETKGALLITHWGLSGPAILKLSAWAARELFHTGYRAMLQLQLIPDLSFQQIRDALLSARKDHAAKNIIATPLMDVPKSLWQRIISHSGIGPGLCFSQLSNQQLAHITSQLTCMELALEGKGLFKEEFVTAGGIPWSEINSSTMESKKCPGIFFAGEVVDSDGVTGGFNFQNAWSTAWIASEGIISYFQKRSL